MIPAIQTRAESPVAPRVGEMVLVGRRPGCIVRVIGQVNGHWWVETSASPYGVVGDALYDTGRTRLWTVRPYSL